MTKAREVRIVIQNKGMERGVIALLEELFEAQAAIRQTQVEVAQHLLQMSNLLDQIAIGATGMRKQIERIMGVGDDEDDTLPPTAGH